MTSLSFHKFTDSLVTQSSTWCQMVEFWLNMDIYDMESIKNWNYGDSLWIHCVIITLRFRKIHSILHNSANIQDKRLKIESHILLNWMNIMTTRSIWIPIPTGMGWEWEYDFPLWGSPYGNPYEDPNSGKPNSHSHPIPVGMGIYMGFPIPTATLFPRSSPESDNWLSGSRSCSQSR